MSGILQSVVPLDHNANTCLLSCSVFSSCMEHTARSLQKSPPVLRADHRMINEIHQSQGDWS
eukprot:1690263-Rhodomonas_salina.2